MADIRIPDKPNAKSSADVGDLQDTTPWDAGEPPSDSTDTWADLYAVEDHNSAGTRSVGPPS